MNYQSKKIKIFLIGIVVVIFSEVSVNLITENDFKNLMILMLLPTSIIISYLIFINKVKVSS